MPRIVDCKWQLSTALIFIPLLGVVLSNAYVVSENSPVLDALKLLSIVPLCVAAIHLMTTMLSLCGAWLRGITSDRGKREWRMLEKKLKEQQLASLRNQISPHFLFNALNAIRALVYKNQDKAADALTDLATLFRYHLAKDLKSHTSLKEEWQLCQLYLNIEMLRFEHRLTVKVEGVDEHKQLIVPALSLLTLVENAVKHGIAHLTEGGVIEVHCLAGEDSITIKVSNPINKMRVRSGSKKGLTNLQSRLKMMFGDAASLNVVASQHAFCAEMALPYGGKGHV